MFPFPFVFLIKKSQWGVAVDFDSRNQKAPLDIFWDMTDRITKDELIKHCEDNGLKIIYDER